LLEAKLKRKLMKKKRGWLKSKSRNPRGRKWFKKFNGDERSPGAVASHLASHFNEKFKTERDDKLLWHVTTAVDTMVRTS
jgi:hypothetical protein